MTNNAYTSPATFIGSKTTNHSHTRKVRARPTPKQNDIQYNLEAVNLSLASWKVDPTMYIAHKLTILSRQLGWPEAKEVTTGKDQYGTRITQVLWKDFGIMCSRRATLSLTIGRAIGFRLRTPKPATRMRQATPTQTLAGLLQDSCNIQRKPLSGNNVTSHPVPRLVLRERMLSRAKENSRQ